ncbi:hypothetical protein V3H18_03605 [Methylocystis sp. 9N]|uniref:Uncharacterized protein n=1 Tax=Methylocystis borbori TaxID=3118750 RepID=A0ABU7XDY9_9HYPH
MARQGWAIFGLGLLLMLFGLYGMWAGWDQILLERGWSQFIAGATAVSGGAVTMALGRVANLLGRLSAQLAEKAQEPAAAANRPAAKPVGASAREPVKTEATPSKEKSPVEVDRYTAGEAVYVMFSDGSVEVHGAGGAQRYPSLAALRAQGDMRRS